MARSDFYNTRKNRFEWKLVILILIIMLIGKGVNKVKEFFTGGNEEDKPTKAAVETVDDTSKDKEDKSIVEVQKSEKREEPPASTATNDTADTTTTSGESDWYVDTPSADEVTSTANWDSAVLYKDGQPFLTVAYADTDVPSVSYESANSRFVFPDVALWIDDLDAAMVDALVNYVTDVGDYFDVAGVSEDDVLQAYDIIVTNILSEGNITAEPSPLDPVHIQSLIFNYGVSEFNMYEVCRMTFTVHQNYTDYDIEPMVSEITFKNIMDAEITDILRERG